MKKKGFTLIELLAVIVVLAVVSLIIIPTILGVIEKSKKGAAQSSTLGYIEAIETKVSTSEIEGKTYENKEDYVYDEIEVDVKGMTPTGGIYSLEDGKVKRGTFCIDNYEVEYEENETKVVGTCTGEDLKLSGSIKLSESYGKLTYPDELTFEVIENISGGELSCETSDSSVATCSIKGTTVTVTPGTKKGNTTLTIKSASTSKYKEAKAAYEAITTEGLLSVTAIGYEAIYDGEAHGITVESSGATIMYGIEEGTYDLSENPTYTDVGTYTVYYQVTSPGYKTVKSSKQVIINQAENPIEVEESNLTYTGIEQALVTVTGAEGNVCYSTTNEPTSCETSNIIPTVIDAGSYTVYYYVAGNKNYKSKSGSVSVTVGKKDDKITLTEKTYTYDGAGKTADLNVTSGLTPSVTYYSNSACTTSVSGNPTNVGVYYAKATTSGDKNYNESSLGCTKAVTINKANNTLTLSANTGTVTYPNSTTFTVKANTSGGSLSCYSSNTNAATCSISGNTVTVTPGTTAANANITVTSAATTNYNAATATYVVTSKLGTLSVTANGYSAMYDGAYHGISVTSSGATIMYGTSSGIYNSTSSPTYRNVGTYTVYYQVTRSGYQTVTGSRTVTITPATASNEVNGVVTYYSSLTAAINASSSGNVNLLQDTSEVVNSNFSGTKNLYLNGHGVYNYFHNYSSSTLNVYGPGKIYNTSDIVYNEGSISFNSVDFEGGWNASAGIINGGSMSVSGGSWYIYASKYSISNDSSSPVYLQFYNSAAGTRTINGNVIGISRIWDGVEIQVWGYSYEPVILFPTWTTNNDQDDIEWPWGSSFSSDFGSYRYVQIIKKYHNEESGQYITHIYAANSSGAATYFIGGLGYNID